MAELAKEPPSVKKRKSKETIFAAISGIGDNNMEGMSQQELIKFIGKDLGEDPKTLDELIEKVYDIDMFDAKLFAAMRKGMESVRQAVQNGVEHLKGRRKGWQATNGSGPKKQDAAEKGKKPIEEDIGRDHTL